MDWPAPLGPALPVPALRAGGGGQSIGRLVNPVEEDLVREKPHRGLDEGHDRCPAKSLSSPRWSSAWPLTAAAEKRYRTYWSTYPCVRSKSSAAVCAPSSSSSSSPCRSP